VRLSEANAAYGKPIPPRARRSFHWRTCRILGSCLFARKRASISDSPRKWMTRSRGSSWTQPCHCRSKTTRFLECIPSVGQYSQSFPDPSGALVFSYLFGIGNPNAESWDGREESRDLQLRFKNDGDVNLAWETLQSASPLQHDRTEKSECLEFGRHRARRGADKHQEPVRFPRLTCSAPRSSFGSLERESLLDLVGRCHGVLARKAGIAILRALRVPPLGLANRPVKPA